MAGSGASPHSPHSPGSPLARAEPFVWLTARVLEQRRFAHHFLGKDADAVEAALAAYQGDDGGYGYALEPDLRGPVSQPLHTAHALRVLDSVGRLGGRLVERVCRYLTGVSTKDGALPVLHPSQRGYPAAPFVPVLDDPPSALLATGPVVGLLHRNQVWHAWLFRATDFCWAAVDALETSHPYEVEAAVAFLDGAADRSRAEAAADRLGRLVREQRLAVLDPARLAEFPISPGYAPGEHHFPHDYARVPQSLARRWFTDEEMKRSLDHLEAEQREDGGWPVRWRAWAPGTALECRPMVTIEALRTLRAYGRFIG
ncbi:hypothetical protein ACFYN0_33440 [Streptomyces sp. NPDC006704]|uniref:hypothetical protein n=1 Tax=Streptomyces sp. NPDC006704 TaxID=3364760 RepID=UPI0036B1F9D6